MSAVPIRFPLPRQPVLEFATIRRRVADVPSLLDLPNRTLTHSGRSAIVLALQLLRIGRGSGVLVPTYHCPTMIAPVEFVGGTPVFYPVTATGTPDLGYLDRCRLPAVRAMLVPHLFGLPVPLDEVAAFCRSRDIALIEDCAHCFFGVAGSRAVGTTGDYSVGSLPKFFPVVEGGILASAKRPVPESLSDRPIGSEIRAAWDVLDLSARTGRLGLLGACVRATSRARQNSRRPLNTAQHPESTPAIASTRDESLRDPLLRPAAARRIEVNLVMRNDLAWNARRRRENFESLVRGLADLPEATPLIRECGFASAPYVMPLLVRDPDECYERMRAVGIPVFRWDRLWPGTPTLPNDSTLVWSRGVIQIACHQSLRDTDVGEICRLVRACVAR
jgi:dTDP-4-amino-4,6-dideoxygalactose transaminase